MMRVRVFPIHTMFATGASDLLALRGNDRRLEQVSRTVF